MRDDEDLDLIFTWRERRKVSHALTLQYDKTIYLLPDTPVTRRLIHKYIEVYEYPAGRIELLADGTALPYTVYDRFPEADQGGDRGEQAAGPYTGDCAAGAAAKG
jgi:hypothetical protein